MANLFDGNGNEIEIGGGESGKLDVTDYKIYEESNGTQSRQGVLTYNGLNLYPVNMPLQRENETKLYSGGLMVTLGDSYTAYLSSYFDKFANAHGLIQKNVGLASSKIARPEGEGLDTVKSFVTRLDELIASFPITISGKAYTTTDVKLITFMGGANDWTTVDTEKSIDRIGNRYSTDKGQIYGATKYCLETLQKTFPSADIIVILQPNNGNNTDFCVMEMKENIVKECAEMYSLPICDCCFNFYSPSNPTELSKYWQSDKLHLNADGHQKLIDKLEVTLNTLDYYKSQLTKIEVSKC